MRGLRRFRSLRGARPLFLGAALSSVAVGAAGQHLALSGDMAPAHDPVLIREGQDYYVYSTGQRGRVPLVSRRSRDLRHWTALPSPLGAIPDWALVAVPGAREIWAPDIARVGDRYRLYYSVSRFGQQRSVIGLATAATLDPASPAYGWRDEGLVVASQAGDPYNAIDPAFARDRQGGEWLAFGSFWDGIQLVRLDPRTGKPAPGAAAQPIARRGPGEGDGGANPIEAPFIIDHGGWYWLIVSFDLCCRGTKSSYHLTVGRARSIVGPYVDRAGRPMLDGGGTVLLQADAAGRDRFRGPGHAGILQDRDGRDYLIHHAYDAAANGTPTLRIARLRWDAAGWPFVGKENP